MNINATNLMTKKIQIIRYFRLSTQNYDKIFLWHYTCIKIHYFLYICKVDALYDNTIVALYVDEQWHFISSTCTLLFK